MCGGVRSSAEPGASPIPDRPKARDARNSECEGQDADGKIGGWDDRTNPPGRSAECGVRIEDDDEYDAPIDSDVKICRTESEPK